MAAIDSYLEAILSATYGRQVRGSIHDALKAMNTESGSAASTATSAQTTANTALTNAATAQSTADNAASAASAAQTTANTAVTNAATAQSAAESAATAAQAAQTTANTAVTNAATAQTAANNAATAAATANSEIDGLKPVVNGNVNAIDGLADALGVHPAYTLILTEGTSIDDSGVVTEPSGTTPVTSNLIRVPASGNLRLTWTSGLGKNSITMAVYSAAKAYLNKYTSSVQMDSVQTITTDDKFTDAALQPGQYVRFQWPNTSSKYARGMTITDAYVPEYGNTDDGIKSALASISTLTNNLSTVSGAASAAQATADSAATAAATAQTTAEGAVETAQSEAATTTAKAAAAIDSSVSRAFDVPAETRAANVFHGISENVTIRTLTVSPFGWSSVRLSGVIPAAAKNYVGLIPFSYTFEAGKSYTIYATGQSEITGLLVRPYGANYVKQGGNTVSGIVNGGAVNFVPDETITVSYINAWHDGNIVAEDTEIDGELVIMIVPGAYTTNDFTGGSAIDGVPRYWTPALDTAIAKIQALDGETGTHGDSFVFFTDYHIQKNANRSAALIKEIVASTAVDKVFYGGDTLDEQTAKAQAYVLHRKFWRQFDGLRVFPIYGNHDNNDNNKQTDEDILTYNEVYSLFGKRVEKYGIDTTFTPDTHNEDGLISGTETTWRERWGHTEPLGNYYYYDNTPQKIRYIVLNGFFAVKAGDQGTWFRNTLNATAAGWTIVVLCHAWWQDPARTKYSTTTGSLINALDAYIKGGGAAKVACWIAGHLHYDYSEMIDTVVTSGDDAGKTYSFPVIITTCDSYLNDTTNMTLGTATEQAFDVVHVDTYNQTVKCTRVGAGSDRLSYTYGFNA